MRICRIASACVLLFATSSIVPSLLAQKKATLTTPAASSEAVSFDIYLPSQHKAELEKLLTDLHTPGSGTYHQWLTPAQFQSQFGPSSAKLKAIQSELAGFGLASTQTSSHILHVTGSANQVSRALSTSLSHALMPNGKPKLVAITPLSPPSSVADAQGLVLGFSNKIRMSVHPRPVPANRYSQAGGYWFDDLKQAYDWPSYKVANGQGVTIGILMSGGFSQADMNLYFNHEGLASPKYSVENIFGGSPYNPNDDGTFEAELDLQQSGGMAPNANIVLYSIPDLSDDSLVAGLVQIVEENRADVVSMSFGGPELFYAPEYNGGEDYTGILVAEDDLMAEGNALGMTFIASSGDLGAVSIPPIACFTTNANPCGAMLPSAEFPASSPHVVGVGGTNLGTATHPNNPSNLNSSYLYEEAFADPAGFDFEYGTTATGVYWGSGGGDSIVFKKPAFQKLIATGSKVRAVPDIALHMGGCPGGADAICNPEDSYDIEALGGTFVGVIGTSASAPDFAGLSALNVQLNGRQGNENYYVYALAAAKTGSDGNPIYHLNIPGYNGLYTSGNSGYNRVLGVGTPYGREFLQIPTAKAAGDPQTPTNP